MEHHFNSFTPEAMRGLGEQLAADFRQRLDFINQTRSHTAALLDTFRHQHRAAERQRRQQAARATNARTLFAKDLKSSVHSLLGSFQLRQQEVAANLREMAGELQSARQAWRERTRARRRD